MEHLVVQRRGSYLYTEAYRKLVVLAEFLYAALGAGLAALAATIFDSLVAAAVVFGLALIFVAVIWLLYKGILWVFGKEARQSVEITDEGIMEVHGEREHSFIPWAGVTEIEVDALVVAGATLRVKGNFCRVTVSNVDLVITKPMRIRDMHSALGQTRLFFELLGQIRARAPQARLRLNRLARRRMGKYDLSGSI